MLGNLHALLADIYGLEMSYDIHDFLITDEQVADALDRDGRRVDEKLLISEGDDHAEVSLYLEPNLVERLTEHDPTARLTERNLADFWTAFEGVSHFTYYAWNASVEKPVRLLELELQAEVDKFIATNVLLQRQGEKPPSSLHQWLFDLPRYDRRLSASELDRYRFANHYAGKYCLKLGPGLANGLAPGQQLQRELREFYRFSQPNKIQHIESR